MNTRLQVEHGITELVTGLDLVAWQIRVAAGEALPPALSQITPHGHAIEVRLYAEDPWAGFHPVAGRVGAWRMPLGPGVRVDAGIAAGDEIATAYDPLLAKIMVHGEDRDAAVARLRRALDETAIGGVATTLGFHRWLVDQPAYRAGTYDIRFIPETWRDGPPLTADDAGLAATAVARVHEMGWGRAAPSPAGGRGPDGARPWADMARQDAVEVRVAGDGRP
jgi:acetyl/propionyl-CoA carboxylase alpha subunit